MKRKLRRRTRKPHRTTEEEVCEINRGTGTPLGSRIAARFRGVGLDPDLAELRGQLAQPADFEW
jgi:hypothetical protein